jgi:hypothetical protein
LAMMLVSGAGGRPQVSQRHRRLRLNTAAISRLTL